MKKNNALVALLATLICCPALAQGSLPGMSSPSIPIPSGSSSGSAGCAPTGATAGYLYNNGSSGCSTSSTLTTNGSVDTESGTLNVSGTLQLGGVTLAGANPSATAGATANNGSAITYMRSDASPAIQLGTASLPGLLQGDGSTLGISAGVISVSVAHGFAWAGNNTHTGTEDFSGTTTPTMVAGHAIIGGIMTAPTFGANGEGAIYLSSTLGTVVQGQGSTSDFSILNKSGTTICSTPTGTSQWICAGGITSTGFVAQSTTAGQLINVNIRNLSANAAATNFIQIGNNTSATEVTGTLNSSANTAGNGTSSFTINNSEATQTGGIFLQTQGTNAITISKAQAVGMPGLALSSAAQTGTMCWTTGGNLTVDTTAGCLTSLLAAKNITEHLSPAKAMEIVSRLDPFAFRYKQGWGDSGRYEQFGLGAEEVALVDERLVGRDPEGKLQGVRYQELTAVLIGAIQQQQKEIDRLRHKQP